MDRSCAGQLSFVFIQNEKEITSGEHLWMVVLTQATGLLYRI